MKPLELLFALLRQFIRFEPGRLTSLQDQAALWEKETREKADSPIGRGLRFSELWYCQVSLAVVFLFAVKSISQWMMREEPGVFDDDDEDFDGEEDEIPVRTLKRFNLGERA